MKAPSVKPVRCAIYTRVSTDQGLDQEFNSLDAQYDASLIAELRSQNFSIVQEAPSIDGDKVMRLRGQTAKIANGFVLFPKDAHWLDSRASDFSQLKK
jgi:phage terminase large subunit-like protein